MRTPVRGGADRRPAAARGSPCWPGAAHGGVAPASAGPRCAGWSPTTHLRGERGKPVTTPDLLARWSAARAGRSAGEHDKGKADSAGGYPCEADVGRGGKLRRAGRAALVVLLGPDSDVGRAVLAKRHDRARDLLGAWQHAAARRARSSSRWSATAAPRAPPAAAATPAACSASPTSTGVPAVLTAAVRHVDPGDVAHRRRARRRPPARRPRPPPPRPGHRRRPPRRPPRRCSPSARRGHRRRTPPARRRGCSPRRWPSRRRAPRTPGTTSASARSTCPSRSALGIAPGTDPHGRPRAALPRSGLRALPRCVRDAELHAVQRPAHDELKVIGDARLPDLLPHRRRGHRPDPRAMGVRVAARGSGAGSLVNYLLGISGVDPIRYRLLMERFCSPLRAELPDIDIDVESARRTEIYEAILDRFGGERVTCVSMMDTYKVRHAIRDVGAALGLPPVEIDEIAKAFPHIRARNARNAIAELPELRTRGLDAPRLQTLFDLVERLDGLPRHIALHPCGVVLSDTGLLDRTPVEASWLGFPMSQFDKDDVEDPRAAQARRPRHPDAVGDGARRRRGRAGRRRSRSTSTTRPQVPLDDEATFRLIRDEPHPRLLPDREPRPARADRQVRAGALRGPHHRHLAVPARPGQVRHDHPVPRGPARLEQDPLPPPDASSRRSRETEGVVVFHEQVLHDRRRDDRGDPRPGRRGAPHARHPDRARSEIEALVAPGGPGPRLRRRPTSTRSGRCSRRSPSFGFCKAHAAAFALPTYHSAWLKTHHPAAFLAGVLTHDPGMYPKRLILDDARTLGIAVLGARRQRLRPTPTASSGSTHRMPVTAPRRSR